MPPVVVRDLLVHPRENDLVVGTYGRGAWITDISPLQQFTAAVRESECYLFDIEPKPQMNFSQQAWWGNYHMTGSNHIHTPNEPVGLEIWYYFRENHDEKAKITITNEKGEEIHSRTIEPEQGMHKLYWNTLRSDPGEYTVTLAWNNNSISKTGIVTKRWLWPVLNFK
jgi:hypothetical protein